VFVVAFAARRVAPQLSRAIDSWGVRSPAKRHEIQSWKSIFKVTGAVALFFNVMAPLIFWTTQSAPARKIHEIDLIHTTAVLPIGAKYIRLTGVVARRFWLVYRNEDGSDPVSIAPVVGDGWSPADPVRFFVVADGEKPSPFEKKGPVRIAGEPARAPSDIERQAIERYRSKGLNIDHAFVILESKDLPSGGYAPIDYDFLTGLVAVGLFLPLVVFVVQVIGRYKDKHKIGEYVIRVRQG